MDDDRKSKWLARSTQVGAKCKTDPVTTNHGAGEFAGGSRAEMGRGSSENATKLAAEPPPRAPTTRPGAVAVPGPGIADTEGGGDVNEPPQDAEDGEDDDVLHVESYAVRTSNKKDVELDEDELRRRILASTARAEEVVPSESELNKARRQCCWIAASVVAVVVAAAIAVGIAVSLASQQQSTSEQGPEDGDVIASMTYMELQGSGGFAYAVRAETRNSYSSTSTSGTLEMIWCKAKPCTESDTNCVVGELYEPGCCFGSNCTDETKCGELCPQPPESCYLIDPTNVTCFRPECYACNQVNGEDMYVVNYFAASIDCLEVGTAVRPDNGETYKWAIFCGPVIAGPKVEENRDLGEYQCGAFRIEANYSDDKGGVQTASFPCQFIALAECGCGPSDMYTFGLPEPTGPCLPESGCPILCEDAGPTYARNLCRSFPGNISYWEGQNAFNSTLFYENIVGDEYELEIYIKDIDSKS